MALTYRSVKGSALTIKELDDNFRHFTGSHDVNGDLTITGSFSVLSVSGSNPPPKFDIDFLKMEITGGLDISRDLIVRDDLDVKDETTLDKQVAIGYQGNENLFNGYTLSVSQSTDTGAVLVEGATFISGSLTITGSSTITGNITASGQISSSATVRGQNIIAANQLQGNDLDIVTNAQIGGYLNTSGSVIFRNLSTTEPTVTGSLWISGSGIGSHSGSGYLMIFNP